MCTSSERTPAEFSGQPWQQVLATATVAWPAHRWREVGVVVGCSGGADSVGLLRALARLREPTSGSCGGPPRGFLVAAHFNHGLRGGESDADEHFVRQLADKVDAQFVVERASGGACDEASMRDQRLTFLAETAKSKGARYVALAHTADDNVETVLHHLMRGTGPMGLSGISRLRPFGDDLVLIRPLVSCRRALIRDGLRAIGQTWREDSSNQDTTYRRNWIRRELLPLIESEYPNAIAAIDRAIDGQRQWCEVIDRLAQDWLDKNLRQPCQLDRDPSTEAAIIVRALQMLWDQQQWSRGEMDRDHWQRLTQTIRSSQDERYTLPGGLDVRAEGRSLTIR